MILLVYQVYFTLYHIIYVKNTTEQIENLKISVVFHNTISIFSRATSERVHVQRTIVLT